MTEHLAPPRGDGTDTQPIPDAADEAAAVEPPIDEHLGSTSDVEEVAPAQTEDRTMPVEPGPAEEAAAEPAVDPEPIVATEEEPSGEAGPIVRTDAEPAAQPGSGVPPVPDATAEPVAGGEPVIEPWEEPVVQPESIVEPEPIREPEPITPVPASPRTVAAYLAEALHAGGARWAFTVPGESFLGLLDALGPAGIRVVGTRHEGGASFMAEAVAQLTGRPALVLGTRAVGASNLAIGLHTARADSTPVIALVGQVERPLLGREAFQEADLVTTIGGLTKWAAQPERPDEVPAAVAEALRRATTDRPGPVLLSLPEDLLDEPVHDAPAAPGHGLPPARPDPGVLRSILQLLAAADRPVILAGGGVLRARCSNDLVRLAEQLRVPIVASWRRPDVVPNDHPLFLGMTGYGAPAIVRERLEAADAILVLGARLSEVASFGYRVPHAGQRWAHVDLEPRGAGAGLPRPDLALASDARVFVRAALDRLRSAVLDAATADARAERNATDRAAWESAATVDAEPWDGPGVHPGRIVTTLRRVLPDDAILTTDAGNMSGWLARGFRFRRPGTFVGPTSGAMGYGLPAAIAAALVHRDRAVVAWTGDGGFAMTMQELETAVRERLRLVALVLDNERYGTIRMHQDDRPGSAVATDLGPIDFAQVARGLGANGVRLASEDGFEAALRTALVGDRPTVIQLALDRRWVSVDRPAVAGTAPSS